MGHKRVTLASSVSCRCEGRRAVQARVSRLLRPQAARAKRSAYLISFPLNSYGVLYKKYAKRNALNCLK